MGGCTTGNGEYLVDIRGGDKPPHKGENKMSNRAIAIKERSSITINRQNGEATIWFDWRTRNGISFRLSTVSNGSSCSAGDGVLRNDGTVDADSAASSLFFEIWSR